MFRSCPAHKLKYFYQAHHSDLPTVLCLWSALEALKPTKSVEQQMFVEYFKHNMIFISSSSVQWYNEGRLFHSQGDWLHAFFGGP